MYLGDQELQPQRQQSKEAGWSVGGCAIAVFELLTRFFSLLISNSTHDLAGQAWGEISVARFGLFPEEHVFSCWAIFYGDKNVLECHSTHQAEWVK